MKRIILILIAFLISTNIVNAEELSCTTTLKKGIKGSNVELLQTKLNQIMDCKLEVDGIYGSKTATCVSNFQKANNLTETGTVNKSTCNAINNYSKEKTSTNTFTTLKKGSRGDEVKTLQTKLNQIMGCKLEVDGIYGSKTATCVSQFQTATNLTNTGTVNKSTYDAINEFDENSTCPITLKKGSKGELVKTLQTRLNKIMGCDLKVDGKYGTATATCVSKFQATNNLTETGTFDTTTCNTLTKIEKETAGITELKKGIKGDAVLTLQTKLNQIMDCNLALDGSYGNLTASCVMKYQMNSNLEVTGTINPMTYYKLMNQQTPIEKEPALEITEKSIIITSDNTEIRTSASASSKVIKKASLGEIYPYETTTKKNSTTWYKVKLDDGYGYIKSTNISKNFIVVDKSLQKLILYKNEQVILSTEVVTGMYENHDTPTGYYTLKTKNLVKGKYLRGYYPDGSLEYKSWVDYWMPFITSRGIGFHDASWRSASEFTDTRYLYDGSHGCVNMKKEAAKTLFNSIDKDIDVIIRN